MKPTYVKPVLETITFEDKESISMVVNNIKTFVPENILDSCFSDVVQSFIDSGDLVLNDPIAPFGFDDLDMLQPGTLQAS